MTGRTKFKKLIRLIIDGIEDVKGNEISLLDLRKLENRISDYFIICIKLNLMIYMMTII